MIAMTLADAAIATAAKANGADMQCRITGLAVDTRKIRSGDLFFALDGAKFLGSDFLVEAQRAGAIATVTHRPRPDIGPQLVVEDAGQALMKFANALRHRLTARVVAITGSNGKTTTKDAMASVFASHFTTVAAKGSFNNRVGLPLTMARAEEDTEILVLEVGASLPGEISRLTRCAEPDLAVVTSIGPSHLEGMGDLATVLREKLSIVDGMRDGAILILNGDDPALAKAMTDEVLKSRDLKILSYGWAASCDVRPHNHKVEAAGQSFSLSPGGPRISFGLKGQHNLSNFLAVCTVALELGLSAEEIAMAAGQVKPAPMRLEERQMAGCRVILDCYNANPASAMAALKVLKTEPCSGRKIAVFGDMLELGSRSKEHHRVLGEQLADAAIQLVVLVGKETEITLAALAGSAAETRHFPTVSEAKTFVRETLDGDDLVLVKGSRSMAMEEIFSGEEG